MRQHRTKDREEHDVGCRDTERHTEDPLERHVQSADQARRVVPAVREHIEADQLEERAIVGICQETQRCDGKERPNRSACCFEDQHRRDDSQYEVGAAGGRRPVDELIEIDEWPPESDNRERHEAPVEHRDPRTPPRVRRVEEERQDKREEEKGRSVDLWLDNSDDPVQRIEGESCSQRCRDGGRPSRELTGRFG